VDEVERQHRLQMARERTHILEAIVTGLAEWRAVGEILRESPDAADAVVALREALRLSEVQATAVLDMQFRRLTQQNRERISEELLSLRAYIAELEAGG
jgi:DNA gyrase subunit A